MPVEGVALLGADIVIAVYLEAANMQPPRTFTDVLSRSFNIIQRHSDLAWRQQADVVIEPDMKSFVWDDFTRTPELVAAGEAAALAVLPKIRELVGQTDAAAKKFSGFRKFRFETVWVFFLELNPRLLVLLPVGLRLCRAG